MSDPAALIDAFLRAHSLEQAVPAVLYAKGEALWRDLREAPPTDATWGRFLVALGELAADHIHDARAAAVFFQHALESVRQHGDGAVAAAAAYNQAVLLERRGDHARALHAYRTADDAAHNAGLVTGHVLRLGSSAARLAFEQDATVDRPRLKRTWLLWLRLRHEGSAELDGDLQRRLGRTLAAFLLPEDDPTTLAALWRAWTPHALGAWCDDDPRCLSELYASAAEAASEHLTDEGGDPAAAYRLLHAAARRLG